MDIIMEKDAAAYIRKHSKDNSVMLYIHTSSGGWCAVPSPTVELGKPKKTESFDLYNREGIDIYLKKGIEIRNNSLHVFLRKFLWIKELAVDGMSINYDIK